MKAAAVILLAIVALACVADVTAQSKCWVHHSCYSKVGLSYKLQLFKLCKATPKVLYKAKRWNCAWQISYQFTTKDALDKYQNCEHAQPIYKKTLALTKVKIDPAKGGPKASDENLTCARRR